MLIEFSVTNFRSIRETQTLSMAASKYDKELVETNCTETPVSGLPRLLRSAVIYGPNAAGKSNLLKALGFMKNFVLQSHSLQEGESIDVVPFALAVDTKHEPSEFEIFFIQDSIRYQFGFAANGHLVTKEWLYSYPKGRVKRLYERAYDPATNDYKWYDPSLNGPKELWKKSTRKNALFLSTAIQLNSEQLKPVFNWFQTGLQVVFPSGEISLHNSVTQCATDEGRENIMEFMNAADLSIAGIEVHRAVTTLDTVNEQSPKDRPSLIRFQHKSDTGELLTLNFSEESDGTQKLFSYAGPLLDVLAIGRLLVVDELDTSLHPLMVRFLISLVHNPAINKHNAQLIFTTHDTSVLDPDLYRRDQIWFVEKAKDQSSRLYPLSDFSPRKGEALERNYLHGRYGALPFIGELRF